MFRKFVGIRLVFVFAWAMAVATATPAQAGPGNSYEKSSPTVKIKPNAAMKLEAGLRKKGKVRVIVGLASADEPEAKLRDNKLHTRARRGDKRAAIQRLQNRALNKMSNPRAIKRFRNLSYMALEVTADELSQLQAMDEVETILEDELWRASLNDSAPQIGADAAWTGGYTGSGQTVAIIDTGVDSSHPSLAGKVVAEACFSTSSGRSTSLCPDGENPYGADSQYGPGAGQNCSGDSSCNHGTHVAGIAAGSSSTYTGIAPDAYLMSIQVFSRFDASACGGSSSCLLAYSSDTLRALDWVHDQRNDFSIASVNISLGGGKYQSVAECNQANSALEQAIDNLRSVGIATVAAAGNNGYTSATSRPSCITGAISVGGVGSGDSVASWSNSAPWLSVLAPGSGIKSSIPGTGFSNKSGTSMATPHVAGAIAAMRSADQNASIDQIMNAITTTGVPVTDSRNGITTPRLQLDAAIVELTQEALTPEPEPEPGAENPADVVLTPNQLDASEYGYRWGDGLNEAELSVAFQFTGAGFDLNVTAYDMDYSDEVAVYLNGDLLGYLSKGSNNALNAGDTFAIPASQQLTGENHIVFVQRSPGWVWGVTNLLLAEVTPVPEPEPEPEPEPGGENAADVVLTPNQLDTSEYGYRWGGGLNEAELSVAFQFTGADFDLNVTAYDMDYSDEVAVYLNGDLLGYLSKGPNNGLNAGDAFAIPASQQLTGENQIVFVQRNPGWVWGVTNLLLAEVTPGTEPEPGEENPADVMLTPNQLDSSEYGYRWGDGLYEAELSVAFQFTGADFDLNVTAYDMDYSDEVAVYLNGDILGYLSKGPNNGLNAGDTFAIPASQQLTGENQIVFVQLHPGWVWGVTDLLLSQ